MRLLLISLALVVAFGQAALAASFAREVTGADLAQFDGREVLVLRTSGGVPAPTAYSRDSDARQLKFNLPGTGTSLRSATSQGATLVSSVSLSVDPAEGTQIIVTLSDPALLSQDYFRFSQPSEHIIMLEIYPAPDAKQGSRQITDPENQLDLPPLTTNEEDAAGDLDSRVSVAGGQGTADGGFDPDKLGIATVDLSSVDSQRVLGLAASAGLLGLEDAALVSTEGWGSLVVEPAGQSLANWTAQTPPGELFLAGEPEQIAAFLAQADPRIAASAEPLSDVWAENQPRTRFRGLMGGPDAATRSRLRDDPYSNLYYSETLPGGGRLSDVRVTLDATGGLNLYDVLMYLSQISGISLVLDPYAFDEPTGSIRAPKVPEGPGAEESGPGFRPASAFEPGLQRSGTVRGNFVNVPFDDVLRTILETHELEFMVYSEGQPEGSRYGSQAKRDSYSKPVILVTSPERLEQELTGTNEIDLYQLHYADPNQVTEILQQFNLTSPSGSGWYVYNGGGGSTGVGGGGGRGGGGTGGGGGGSLASPATAGVFAYRGSSRVPVHQQVLAALEQGQSVVRVKLAPEPAGGYLVTLLAR